MKNNAFKFTLYSKNAGKPRLRAIKNSNDLDKLFVTGFRQLKKNANQEKEFFIIEHGKRAIKISNTIIL